MAKKNEKNAAVSSDLSEAKLEAMRIRFRTVLGETVPAHVVRNARKNIAKCVREAEQNERGKNA